MGAKKPKLVFESLEEMLGGSKPESVPDEKKHGEGENEAQTVTTAAEVEGSQMKQEVTEMDFSLMESFPDHKYRLYSGKRLDDMVESIKRQGILQNLILWHTKEGRNIILSGHNRRLAGGLAGLTKGPVTLKNNLTYEEAVFIVNETNFYQRSFADLLPSERAYVLEHHYAAMKSQGKRTDLIKEIENLMNTSEINASGTSSEIQQKSEKREQLGAEYGLNRDNIAKNIRMAQFLVKGLFDLLDENKIPMGGAYHLSFLKKEAQEEITFLIRDRNYKADLKKIELLKQHHEKGTLTEECMVEILSGEKTRKAKSGRPKAIRVKPAVIFRYFKKEQTPKEIEDTIDKALAYYFSHEEAEKEGMVG